MERFILYIDVFGLVSLRLHFEYVVEYRNHLRCNSLIFNVQHSSLLWKTTNYIYKALQELQDIGNFELNADLSKGFLFDSTYRKKEWNCFGLSPIFRYKGQPFNIRWWAMVRKLKFNCERTLKCWHVLWMMNCNTIFFARDIKRARKQ